MPGAIRGVLIEPAASQRRRQARVSLLNLHKRFESHSPGGIRVMRNLFLALAAAAMICSCQSADAQIAVARQVPVVGQRVVVSAPVTRIRTNRSPRRGRVMSSVIEFEQRKNAWFRRRFLGR